MSFKPLSDYVLIKFLDADEKTPGGIYIPPTSEEKSQKGVVIAVGPGRLDDNGSIIPMELNKGDIVLFTRYGGTEITIDNKKNIVMHESAVLGVLVE
jgi:chaperonin GroES